MENKGKFPLPYSRHCKNSSYRTTVPQFSVLKKREDFLQLRKKGKRLYIASGISLNYILKEKGGLCCGWTFAKRFPSAVLRNRLKRWCRSLLRMRKDEKIHAHVHIYFKKRKVEIYKTLRYKNFAFSMDKTWQKLKKSV